MESATEVNAQNLRGMTAMDVLIRSRTDLRDEEIEESLKRVGAFASMENNSLVQINHNITSPGSNLSYEHRDLSSNVKKNGREKMIKQKDGWLEKRRSAIMVMASLSATMAFQVGINPPSGVWQDNYKVDSQGHTISVSDSHKAGESIFAHNHPEHYRQFLIVNTTGLIASLSIILLLMSGLPLKRGISMCILMVIAWIAVTTVAVTYLFSISVITPEKEREKQTIIILIGLSVYIWLGLAVLLLIGDTIRLGYQAGTKVNKMFEPERKDSGSGITSHSTV
ncbi:uncharacterized protein LOC111374615 [Olea europaea var. sylvestris]|uniref:uncharacterized protein LOC111374615 n=1 Tax=Olea europaea var. sylvestris TaxID=158386 RepID=UPI000C1D5934|nr:uncharacterized protein LOC111374615 [Olea europaea var. sylvestris]